MGTCKKQIQSPIHLLFWTPIVAKTQTRFLSPLEVKSTQHGFRKCSKEPPIHIYFPQFLPSQAQSSAQNYPSFAMPPTATRHSETPDSALELGNLHLSLPKFAAYQRTRCIFSILVLVNNALARLSPRQYKSLEKFRNEFPTLKLERRASYPNSFFLFRTQFVAKKKKEKGKNHLDNNGVSNNVNTSGSVEASGGKTNPNIGPKSGSNNQKDYSKEAGVVWRRDYPPDSRQNAYFVSWSHRARDLHKAMHPNGVPALFREKKKPKSSNKSKVPSPSLSPLSPSVLHKSFQPLPTPPISDSGDLEKDLVRDYGNEDALESEDAFEGSDIDEDYVPKNSSRKRKPSRRKHSNRVRPVLPFPSR